MEHLHVLFIFLLMLFNHIVDDFYLQGILGKLKQRSYWEKEAPDEKYKHDYIVALIIHAMSWSFMIMLPVFVFAMSKFSIVYFLIWLVNVIIHAITDNLKCNKREINLIQDQIVHLMQIIMTLLFFV